MIAVLKQTEVAGDATVAQPVGFTRILSSAIAAQLPAGFGDGSL